MSIEHSKYRRATKGVIEGDLGMDYTICTRQKC